MTEVLRQDEKAVLILRSLYESYGYKKYKMSKFENYDLYLENKSFLESEKIVTFSGAGGKLLALKPDITLSIIKNAPKNIDGVYKTYYSENVYRAADSFGDIKEIMQAGIEYIGDVDVYSEAEVLTLAARSLKTISEASVIGISHMGLIAAVMSDYDVSPNLAKKLRRAMADKNIHTMKELCTEAGKAEAGEILASLATIYGPMDEALPKVKAACVTEATKAAAEELEVICTALKATGVSDCFALDFSVSNDMDYYNGIIFQGFVDGIPRHVLSGGRYDDLLGDFGRNAAAVGFAINVEAAAKVFLRNTSESLTKPADVLVFGEPGCEIAALNHCSELIDSGLTVFNSLFATADEAAEYAKAHGIRRIDTVGANSAVTTKEV